MRAKTVRAEAVRAKIQSHGLGNPRWQEQRVWGRTGNEAGGGWLKVCGMKEPVVYPVGL